MEKHPVNESVEQIKEPGIDVEKNEDYDYAILDYFEDAEGNITKEDGEALMARYPNRLEEISVVDGFPSLIFEQRWRDAVEREQYGTRGDLNRLLGMVEYQSLLIHFLQQNHSPKYLHRLWNYFEEIVEYASYDEQNEDGRQEVMRLFPIIKAGLLGQVALGKLFNESGISAHTAKPSDDAYKKIDLWVGNGTHRTALQIKTSKRYKTLEIVKDKKEIPVVSISTGLSGSTEKRFVSMLFKEFHAFNLRVKEYAEEVGHDIEAYVVLIPLEEIDPMTGEPSEELKKQFQEKIANIITENYN